MNQQPPRSTQHMSKIHLASRQLDPRNLVVIKVYNKRDSDVEIHTPARRDDGEDADGFVFEAFGEENGGELWGGG